MAAGDTLDRTVLTASDHVQSVLQRESTSQRDGFLQSVTPAVTLVGVLVLLVVAVSQQRVTPLAVLGGVALALAAASRLRAREMATSVLPVAAMAAVVVAPQAVSLPGELLVGPVTDSGALAVAVFVLRVSVCVSLVTLLLSTTRFVDLLDALDSLGVPAVALTLLGVTHRYLLVFFQAVSRSVRARRSRQIQSRSLRRRWRDAGSMLGTFFVQVLERGEGVQRAARARGGTQARGYETRQSLGRADALFVTLVCTTTGLTLWVGL